MVEENQSTITENHYTEMYCLIVKPTLRLQTSAVKFLKTISYRIRLDYWIFCVSRLKTKLRNLPDSNEALGKIKYQF